MTEMSSCRIAKPHRPAPMASPSINPTSKRSSPRPAPHPRRAPPSPTPPSNTNLAARFRPAGPLPRSSSAPTAPRRLSRHPHAPALLPERYRPLLANTVMFTNADFPRQAPRPANRPSTRAASWRTSAAPWSSSPAPRSPPAPASRNATSPASSSSPPESGRLPALSPRTSSQRLQPRLGTRRRLAPVQQAEEPPRLNPKMTFTRQARLLLGP